MKYKGSDLNLIILNHFKEVNKELLKDIKNIQTQPPQYKKCGYCSDKFCGCEIKRFTYL